MGIIVDDVHSKGNECVILKTLLSACKIKFEQSLYVCLRSSFVILSGPTAFFGFALFTTRLTSRGVNGEFNDWSEAAVTSREAVRVRSVQIGGLSVGSWNSFFEVIKYGTKL